MTGGETETQQGLAARYGGPAGPQYQHPALGQTGGQTAAARLIAHGHGQDVRIAHDRQPPFRQGLTEKGHTRGQHTPSLLKARQLLHKSQHAGRMGGRQGRAVHDGRGQMLEQGREAPGQQQERAPQAQRFAQRAHHQIGRGPVTIPQGLRRAQAASAGTQGPQRMGFVHTEEKSVPTPQGRHAFQIEGRAVHAVQGLGHDHGLRRVRRQGGQQALQMVIIQMVPGPDARPCQRQGPHDAGVTAPVHEGFLPLLEQGGHTGQIGLITAGQEQTFRKTEVIGHGPAGLVHHIAAAPGQTRGRRRRRMGGKTGSHPHLPVRIDGKAQTVVAHEGDVLPAVPVQQRPGGSPGHGGAVAGKAQTGIGAQAVVQTVIKASALWDRHEYSSL